MFQRIALSVSLKCEHCRLHIAIWTRDITTRQVSVEMTGNEKSMSITRPEIFIAVSNTRYHHWSDQRTSAWSELNSSNRPEQASQLGAHDPSEIHLYADASSLYSMTESSWHPVELCLALDLISSEYSPYLRYRDCGPTSGWGSDTRYSQFLRRQLENYFIFRSTKSWLWRRSTSWEPRIKRNGFCVRARIPLHGID